MSRKELATILYVFIPYTIIWGYVVYFHNVNLNENYGWMPFILVAVLFWLYYFREKKVELKKSYRMWAILFSLVAVGDLIAFLQTR